MLVGDGVRFDPHQALMLFREAAMRNDAEANAQLAVCAAWGIDQARDIHTAIDYLRRAANLNWTPAQRELDVLAKSMGKTPSEGEIDIVAWTTPPPARVIRDRPRIVAFERFASDDECRWLSERARPQLSRAMVYRDSAAARIADTRTNRET